MIAHAHYLQAADNAVDAAVSKYTTDKKDGMEPLDSGTKTAN